MKILAKSCFEMMKYILLLSFQCFFLSRKNEKELYSKENLFPLFQEWQVGYGAFTCSFMDKEVLIKYIGNQEEHHKKLD